MFLQFIQSITDFNPSTILTDIFGVIFYPSSGTLGIAPLVPLFVVMVIMLPVLIFLKKIQLTNKDYELIGIFLLVSLGVFFSYFGQIHGLNTDGGVLPDVRYLSPIYLPLTLIGLLALRKIPDLIPRPLDLCKGMILSWIVLVPLSLFVMSRINQNLQAWVDAYIPVNYVAMVAMYFLVEMFFITSLYKIHFGKSGTPARIILILLCAAPLIWQISMSVTARQWGAGLGGYSFWIPVILRAYTLTFGFS